MCIKHWFDGSMICNLLLLIDRKRNGQLLFCVSIYTLYDGIVWGMMVNNVLPCGHLTARALTIKMKSRVIAIFHMQFISIWLDRIKRHKAIQNLKLRLTSFVLSHCVECEVKIKIQRCICVMIEQQKKCMFSSNSKVQ